LEQKLLFLEFFFFKNARKLFQLENHLNHSKTSLLTNFQRRNAFCRVCEAIFDLKKSHIWSPVYHGLQQTEKLRHKLRKIPSEAEILTVDS